MRIYLLFGFIILLQAARGQENILSSEAGQSAPSASLKDVAWLTGNWTGEALGGTVEEVWTAPLGESMMFSFKLVSGGKVQLYELGHIREQDGTLLLQLKHFNPDLTGWEEKENSIDFPLLRLENGKAFFDGITYEKEGEDSLKVTLMQGEGEEEREIVFHYKRKTD